MHDFEYQIANSIFVIRYSNCRIYLWKPIELVIFQGEGGPDPPAFIRILTCFFFKTFFTYLRIFHSVLNHFARLYKVCTWPITWYLETEVRQNQKYDVFSETQIFVLTNNLRCFDETDVRTSQKTTHAQFKIYRTIFIDEIGPCFYKIIHFSMQFSAVKNRLIVTT